MVSPPHSSTLVMLGDLRVAISQSTHTRAWKERKGLWRRYKGKVRLACSHPCLKLSSSTSRIWRQCCRLKPERVNWLGVAMGAFQEVCSAGKLAGQCTPVTAPMSLCEQGLSRHLGNISAPFIRLASSKRPTGLKYGSTPKAMG